MHIHVHDYSGHPFQVQLSRRLAARGHDVLHQFSAEYVTGHGRLTRAATDPATFRVESVATGHELKKYNAAARLRFERAYAREWQRHLDLDPHVDLVVACNVPLFALAAMQPYFVRRALPWVLWHQDVYSRAVADEIDRRLPGALAARLGTVARRLEMTQVRNAAGVIAIADSFIAQYRAWGLPVDHVEVVPNWAPLDDIAPAARDNAWVSRHDLPRTGLRLVYAGTLGRKHNPLLLLHLLDTLHDRGVDAHLVVCSEGVGVDELAARTHGRPDVRILGFQPAHEFAEVLASADVVLALLEPQASDFSVPSKVLSYLSAGRPIVLLAPGQNPAAADVLAAGGFVGDPSEAGSRAAANWLDGVLARSGELDRLGSAARALAEQRFDIDAVTDRIEPILLRAAGRSHSHLDGSAA